MNSLAGARILVTGSTGFLGQYVGPAISALGGEVVQVSRSKGCDLRNEAEAFQAILINRPDIVVHLAATVGGIGANMNAPATFFRDNMAMSMNVVHAASAGRAKLVAVGSVCSYPKDCPIPFKEDDLWNGYPESTNAPYGIAKKAMLVMMQAYRKQHGLTYAYLIPTNLYGPGDHFEEPVSHVIPALIRRFMSAKKSGEKEVVCWGTGKATRSFLFVADAAKAVALACAKLDFDGPVNLPGSDEISISELAEMVARMCGFDGKIAWDPSKPDGQPRRSVDGARAKKLLGWSPGTLLKDGIRQTLIFHGKRGDV